MNQEKTHFSPNTPAGNLADMLRSYLLDRTPQEKSHTMASGDERREERESTSEHVNDSTVWWLEHSPSIWEPQDVVPLLQ